jgi:hypothetical protein
MQHYIFIADKGTQRNEAEATGAVADCNALEFIAPRAWVAKGNPQLFESSFDLHSGLDVDTVPAELLDDLFKL